MDKKKWIRGFFIATLLWTGVIILLSVLPSSELPRIRVQHLDKIIHFTLFLVYGFLWSGLFLHAKKSFLRFITLLLCLFLFGGVMELLQSMVPGRSPDYIDLIFNFAGAISGITTFLVVRSKLFRQTLD